MNDPHEQALVDRLAAEGLISRTRARTVRPFLILLALAGAFWLGFAWTHIAPHGAAEGQKYVLMLYEGPDFRAVSGGHGAEYSAWARADHADGQIVGGEELHPSTASFGPAIGAGPQAAGFFIVQARDAAAALRLARTCPHLRHGGTIMVHPVGE